MATRFNSTLLWINDTDARFQAWAAFIEDTLVTTGGWVVTSDTGQTAPASLVHPTLANTKQGYRIYRMDDSLQGTSPVFMRVDYGSGAGANNPAVWLTIGTGSNGSGTITGILLNAQQITTSASSGSQANNSYGSADTSRFSLGMGINGTTNSITWLICLERSKDASGDDTGDGLILLYSDLFGGINTKSKYLILAGGTQPTTESGWAYILTGVNPSETFSPGDVGVGIVIAMKGVSQQPGTNAVVVNSSDVGNEGNFNMTLYGATRTYQHLNNRIVPNKSVAGASGTPSSVGDTNARICLRYD